MKTYAIEREFGSGGRVIGKLIANECNIPFYDGELLVKAAEGYGLSLDLLKQYDEAKTGSLLFNIALASNLSSQNNMKLVNQLFYGMEQTILKLYREGPAVFVGRCCTEILKGKKDVKSIYIKCSDTSQRILQTMEVEGLSFQSAKHKVIGKDRARKQYFEFWTGKERNDPKNYDVVLDTSELSMEECARKIIS